MKPIIVVNFKTYVEGKSAVELAKKIEKFDKKIIVGVSAADIFAVSSKTKLMVFAQHVDCEERGKATGFILPEAVKANGAIGVFLNHSEHKINFEELKKTVKRCREIGLKVLIFASNLREAKDEKKLNPDYLVYEPPEFVGTKISVSKAKPEVIKKIRKEIGREFLVGAGIHSAKDVQIAMELGASGIAVSSAIATTKNPDKALNKIMN
ncbi:MAG: triose-phosphate isomerase [Candidatus Pacearchaeota archaeon]